MIAKRQETSIEPSFPAEKIEMSADRHLLSRVIDNLLLNAIKHSNPGNKISVKLDASSPTAINVAIADEGPGH